MKYWRVPIIAFILFSGELFGGQNQDSTTMETVKVQVQPDRLKQTQIRIKEKHDFIYDSFKDIYSSYGIDVMKSLAFLVLCIGWFITSDKSRDFYKKNRVVRMSSIIALIVLGIIHITSQFSSYLYSKEKLEELSELRYLDLKYYENYEITFGQLIASVAQNSVLFVVLILILFSMKEATKK